MANIPRGEAKYYIIIKVLGPLALLSMWWPFCPCAGPFVRVPALLSVCAGFFVHVCYFVV